MTRPLRFYNIKNAFILQIEWNAVIIWLPTQMLEVMLTLNSITGIWKIYVKLTADAVMELAEFTVKEERKSQLVWAQFGSLWNRSQQIYTPI